MAGANCACKRKTCKLENCKIRNFKKEGTKLRSISLTPFFLIKGGTCLQGHSEMYLHCLSEVNPRIGFWSNWQDIPKYGEKCSDFEHFLHRHRMCEPSGAYCPGPWLENIPCKTCAGEQISEYEDYNYNYAFSNSYLYDSNSVVLRNGFKNYNN